MATTTLRVPALDSSGRLPDPYTPQEVADAVISTGQAVTDTQAARDAAASSATSAASSASAAATSATAAAQVKVTAAHVQADGHVTITLADGTTITTDNPIPLGFGL